jgi:hypothetical protein
MMYPIASNRSVDQGEAPLVIGGLLIFFFTVEAIDRYVQKMLQHYAFDPEIGRRIAYLEEQRRGYVICQKNGTWTERQRTLVQ